MSDQADSPAVEAPSQTFGAPEVSAAEQAPAQDPMMARLDELSKSIESLRPPAPQQEEPEGYNLQDLAYDDQQYADDGYDEPFGGTEDPDAEAQAQQWLQDQIQQQVQQGIQQAVTPMRIQQQAAQLEQEFPELQKPDVARRVVEQTRAAMERVGRANNLPPHIVDAMSRDPQMVRATYLAERGARNAAQETPADGGIGAHLEGASAQVEAPEEDFMDRLVNQNPSKPFWTG